MKGNGWIVGGLLVLSGLAAPSHAASSAGNIFAAPATVDVFRRELRVQTAAADARAGTFKPAVDTGAQPQTSGAEPFDAKLAAGDQLSNSDRSPADTPPVAQAGAVASKDGPAQRTVAMAGNEHSLWDETSMIGKVFIAFGTLLTLASAARMFMA